MKRLLKSRFFWAGVGLSVLVGVVFVQSKNQFQSFQIGTVTVTDLIQRVTIAGTVIANRKTTISAPYNGYVKRIYVKVGQKVQVGDPIISVSQSLRGDTEDEHPLRAPFPGTVVQVLKTEGEYVEQQSPEGRNAMVRIDDLSRILVQASAPEIEEEKLRIGQEGMIKSLAIFDRTYQGKIQSISLAAKEQKDWDKSRVEFPVLMLVLNPDSHLKPGMSVIVDVIAKKATHVLSLRQEFIQKEGDQYFVVTEKGDKKKIEVGMRNEEAFEIIRGLPEGERVRQTDFLAAVKDGKNENED